MDSVGPVVLENLNLTIDRIDILALLIERTSLDLFEVLFFDNQVFHDLFHLLIHFLMLCFDPVQRLLFLHYIEMVFQQPLS